MRPSPDAREADLLDDYQHVFPLVHAPFAAIAAQLDVDEAWVCERLAHWQTEGRVSRVGAVFRPHSVGVSTLAALAVPEHDLARVAAAVSARAEVNHNYEREHRYNLWFVLAAPDAATLHAALDAIRLDTGYVPISLPLIADYWIDLGFALSSQRDAKHRSRPCRGNGVPIALSMADRRIIRALEDGLPIVHAPFAVVAARADVSEAGLMARLEQWLEDGVIKRFGIVVRHHELGYTANAMCVWDVADADVDRFGEALAREDGVTLCYRRGRARPEWGYNLYCMVHGRDRLQVEMHVAGIAAARGLDRFPGAMLFSRRRFKQRGARYGLVGPQAQALA